MNEYRTTVTSFGTTIVHRPCGGVVIDEPNPTERDVEAAIKEHDCGGREWS